MKFLVIGLGSMGKRRIRILQHLGEKDIIGFDLKEERRKEAQEKYGITTFESIEKAMIQNPDIFIISTSPDHHIEYELLAAKNDKHFFCEAGIFTQGLEELIDICKSKNIVAAPGVRFWFEESVRKIKELVNNGKVGKVVAFTYHMGQYLPDWHPWEDISECYVSQRETSATREMIPYELGWLCWIFGDIEKISCLKGKISSLEADIDDVCQLIFQFKNKIIGHILIDVISRVPTRSLRIVGEKGTIEWDWMKGIVRLYDPGKKDWIIFKEKEGIKEEGYIVKEDEYIEEMKNFLNAINGNGKYIYTLEEDYKILNLLIKAEESAQKGEHIKIDN
ncbi:MAG: Gfo/Idh/MocA family protein [Candidatus Heimdallarchaeaceae archaeon]